MKLDLYKIGIDIGSTTVKLVVCDAAGQLIHREYHRHNTRIDETLIHGLTNVLHVRGDHALKIAFTGSGGMGLAERLELPFIQEVVAASEFVRRQYPFVSTLIDIGGEDAKMVFLEKGRRPDIRMNGSCAGGTGAFIDHAAALLNINISDLDILAQRSEITYPMASRCGVFAKTDIQNLLSRSVPKEDIAASIFQAVALQVINALARGHEIKPKVLFCGGPLAFIPNLRQALLDVLRLGSHDAITPDHAELIPALGAAYIAETSGEAIRLTELIGLIKSAAGEKTECLPLLEPLFKDQDELTVWRNARSVRPLRKTDLSNISDGECYLGIDAGSTTIKIVVTDMEGRLVYSHYTGNNGHPLKTVVDALERFHEHMVLAGKNVRIIQAAVTGYGEDLIKAALGLDHGLVETMAHYLAARTLDDQVSFLLDIGGQDMKAIFIHNNAIQNIEINEACSSGCGSFIEGFAASLGLPVADFADLSCLAQAPCELGTRCTVFMNSKVKQALREGASVGDLAAGLAYSVIRNCLTKVLKINDMDVLGGHIVAHGGSFKNMGVLRALEKLTGKTVTTSDQPEIMGAYGAALFAMEQYRAHGRISGFIGWENLQTVRTYQTKSVNCQGCSNRCQVARLAFPNQRVFYSGNKCEKVFGNRGTAVTKGQNIYDIKYELLFNRPSMTDGAAGIRIGVPRTLNIYENFPFWNALLTGCGFTVTLSGESDPALYKKGAGLVMSDNICFPAKLAHGHILDLVEKKVDRILLPMVVFEKQEHAAATNSFNCPIVTGYAEVLKSSMNTESRYGIPLDSPAITFKDRGLLKKGCWEYFSGLGTDKKVFEQAFEMAIGVQIEYKKDLRRRAHEILEAAQREKRPVVLLAGHPYHADRLVQQKSSQMLADLGVAVINEEAAPPAHHHDFRGFFAVPQWAFPNRILNAARWVAESRGGLELVQLNSFGCGPDAFITNEVSQILRQHGKTYTLIRIDDISSPGSIFLRLRSLVESLKARAGDHVPDKKHRVSRPAIFRPRDRKRTILVPWFADFYSPLVPALGEVAGYRVVNLPPPDRRSVELGLKYANNEVCYPATIVVGDIIKALQSGHYQPAEVAVGITQTGGQCRATNYIALLRRAMHNAGFGDVPVIAVSNLHGLFNQQPGFKLPLVKLARTGLAGMLYADALSRLYHATVFRENNPGQTNKLKEQYIAAAIPCIKRRDPTALLALLRRAVDSFNTVPVRPGNFPAIGLVGEIYIKYNSFSQYDTITWLHSQGVEVMVPPIIDFMVQGLVNRKVRQQKNVMRRNTMVDLVSRVLGFIVKRHLRQIEAIMADFRYYRPLHDLHDSAAQAARVMDLVNQYGEGWLIAAEIAGFHRAGVNNVISVQPFGCIANHIIAKGVEKKIKELYPGMNVLFLDFDAGTSQINIQNRLHYLIKNAREPLAAGRPEMMAVDKSHSKLPDWK